MCALDARYIIQIGPTPAHTTDYLMLMCQGLFQNYAITCIIDNLLRYSINTKNIWEGTWLCQMCFQTYASYFKCMHLCLYIITLNTSNIICWGDRGILCYSFVTVTEKIHTGYIVTLSLSFSSMGFSNILSYSLMLIEWSVAMEKYWYLPIISPFISSKPNIQSQ